jgi:hypothetical protein
MKTSNNQYQLLLEQATAMYNSEKKLSGMFKALTVNTDDANLKQEISLEAKENKRQCIRLEGLLEVLDRTPYKYENQDEVAKQDFVQQFAMMLKRVAFKHAAFGYRTAIVLALALGQNEIASFLRCSMGHGNLFS